MQSGVATLYPDVIKDDPLSSKVVIDRVLANGKAVALYGAIEEALPGTNASSLLELGQTGAELHLPLGRRQVEICFTAPVFTMPESIRFKYQLQGLDKEWIEAGARRPALYSQLAPGRYTFQVIACNRDGVWNEQGATLAVTVPPFWWETVWFRVGWPLCAFGLVGGLVVLGLRRRQQFKIEKLNLQQAIERVRVHIAQDLHDDLGAGLTEVALLSEVVRLNLDTPDVAEKNSRRIFASSREMTQALDEIVWSVNPANDTLDKLVAFVCEFSQAFLGSAAIPCEVDVPAVVPDLEVNAQIRHQICMMVKECLANVIKHARAKTVTLTLRLEGRSLEITVEDDGVGFDPARVKDTTGTHDGLVNLKKRLTVMNGTCELQSVRGQGTRIRLVVGL
jgi:signal transduction histidine kinase